MSTTNETPTADGKPPREMREVPRGPLSDVRPDADDHDTQVNGGEPATPIEKRPIVSTVTPEDYPLADRQISSPDKGKGKA